MQSSPTPRLLLALGLALAACTLPKMAVKPELAPQEPFDLPVFSLGGRVDFGPFHVKDVDRGALDSNVSRERSAWFPEWIKSLGTIEKHEDYAFTLEEAGQPARPVSCRASRRRTCSTR